MSKIWHDVALRGKMFMLGFFDPDVESSVQEPSLAAAKGWASSNTSTWLHLTFQMSLFRYTYKWYRYCRYYVANQIITALRVHPQKWNRSSNDGKQLPYALFTQILFLNARKEVRGLRDLELIPCIIHFDFSMWNYLIMCWIPTGSW